MITFNTLLLRHFYIINVSLQSMEDGEIGGRGAVLDLSAPPRARQHPEPDLVILPLPCMMQTTAAGQQLTLILQPVTVLDVMVCMFSPSNLEHTYECSFASFLVCL